MPNMITTMCQDRIRNYFISTIKLDEERDIYETIVVRDNNWGLVTSMETADTLRKARAAHRRACENILHDFRYARPRPEIENVYTHHKFWEKREQNPDEQEPEAHA